MEKITFNNEQLEFLKFIVQDFEYNDEHEKCMIDQITNKIYDAQEHQLLRSVSLPDLCNTFHDTCDLFPS